MQFSISTVCAERILIFLQFRMAIKSFKYMNDEELGGRNFRWQNELFKNS
jgi:hypothetical protein